MGVRELGLGSDLRRCYSGIRRMWFYIERIDLGIEG